MTKTKRPRTRGGKPVKALDKEVQEKIGLELRAMYDEVVRQGVPDRFAELVRRLDRHDDEHSK